MMIPDNVIANADDLGLQPSINRAILYCFEQGYINSASLLTNTEYFDETVYLIHQNPSIINIGVHVNLAEGKPVTNFDQEAYLDSDGNWNLNMTNKKVSLLPPGANMAFAKEINAQIDKTLSAKIPITHLDSHYHIHTLPAFYKLFLKAANSYNLKLRLAQTYSEGSWVKFTYRKYVNSLIKKSDKAYSGYFETVDEFLKNTIPRDKITEVMLHPDFDPSNNLTDHYDSSTLSKWTTFLEDRKQAKTQ